MADLSTQTGPFRITTVLDSAHGGFFSFNGAGGAGPYSYSSGNSAIFRSTTRYLWSPKNSTATTFSTFQINSIDDGTVTITFSTAPSSAVHHYYFQVFNGGTMYTLAP
jgi:hypothetical protein